METMLTRLRTPRHSLPSGAHLRAPTRGTPPSPYAIMPKFAYLLRLLRKTMRAFALILPLKTTSLNLNENAFLLW